MLYHIYSICAAPLNCAALQYYSKGFILVSLNCTAPYFLLTFITSVFIPEVNISI